MTPENHWTLRLTAVCVAAAALWTEWVTRRTRSSPTQENVRTAMPRASRLSDRQLTIKSFTAVMHEHWAAGNIDMARFIEQRITSLENMTDAEFKYEYEDRTR